MKCVLWLVVLISVAQCSPMSQNELEDFSNFLLKTSSLDIHVKTGADPDASLDEDEVVSDHAWEDSGKFEGDLILNDRQRRLIVENVEGLSRNGLTDSTKRWPNNEVIYFIQIEHFNSGQVQAIQAGIDDLAQASCVKFRPYRKGDRDAVVIQGSRRGCFSQVGYQGGYQVLNLSGRHPVGRGCFRHGTVVHELLHSLGFFHMQSSPDRDDYVDVKWANILQPARHNFRKYNMFSVSDFGVGYDYDSVLHYSRRAFSVNGQDTLVPKKDGAEIGQRVGLSDKDTQKLNKMYCDADYDSAVQADENTTKKPKKKKKPKNKPFEGQGIGYHQGKTVVIKLPAAEIFKIPNVPSTHVFDFSKTPQVMSEAEGYRFGEEITYSYKPISSPDFDITRNYDEPEVKSDRSKHLKLFDATEEAKPSKEINDKKSFPNQANEVKLENVPNDDLDKDLKDAFDRLSKIVKQHINRKNKDYDSKIIKDYSQYAKPSEHQHSESHEKFEQPTSYESSTLTPVSHIDVARSLDYNVQNNQIKDRMDSSFGTSLPTKNSYSVYEQSETPNYATLDYLKIRHDFSDIYSPKPPESKQKVDGISAHVEEPIRHKEHIKIAPYDQGFFTDYLDKNDRLVDPTQIFLKQKVVSSKYEQKEMPKQLQLEKGIDFSHIILLPTKKPYSAHEQTETPIYATLGYLKDRHDISNIYPPNKSEDKTKNEPVTKDDEPPTEDDWHIKDSYKYNPADYDRNSYVDFIRLKDKDKYGSSEEEESAKESLSKAKLKNVPDGYTRETSYKDNGKLTAKNKLNGDKNIQNQSSDDERDDYDYYNKKDDHSSPNENSQPKKEPPYDQHKSDYNNDFEKEYDTYSKESHEVSSTKSPKQNEAYTLYGVPVPLTKDWYKITYSIPDKSKIGEKSS